VRLLDGAGAAIVMEGGNAWPKRLAFFEAVPGATALWWKPAHRARSLVAQRGDGTRSGIPGATATASFVQVNAAVANELRAYVLARARAHHPATAVDAYAGSGDTAIPLARGGAKVVVVEWDRDAVARASAQLPSESRAIAAKVEDVLETLLPCDVLVMNPPRTGVHERVTAILQATATPPRAIIYVSCDPATLGRDLARLPRYAIRSLRSFDMFPQTAPVETVCELTPSIDEPGSESEGRDALA
jgi:23S rRNA (uracil1939-C5)-methyltransferase